MTYSARIIDFAKAGSAMRLQAEQPPSTTAALAIAPTNPSPAWQAADAALREAHAIHQCAREEANRAQAACMYANAGELDALATLKAIDGEHGYAHKLRQFANAARGRAEEYTHAAKQIDNQVDDE